MTSVKVRFRDLDAFGHVNNAVFATYLEQARTETYLALTGRTDPVEDGAGLDFVVARAEIDYLLPVRHGTELRVEVRPARLGRSSFDFAYTVSDGEDALVARGLTTLVAYDHATGRSRPISPELAALIRSGLGAGRPAEDP